MGYGQASLLMALVVVARGTALIFSKTAMAELGAFDVLAWRFLVAFVMLSMLFWPRLRAMGGRQAAHGALVGVVLAALMTCDLLAINYTHMGTVSFLENTAVVLVPLFTCIALRRRPTRRVVACAALALMGVMVMTMGKGGLSGFGMGECLALVGALLYSAQLMLTTRFSRTDDAFAIGIVQLGAAGVACALAATLTGRLAVPNAPQTWGSVLFLALVCGAFSYALQPVAQRGISAEQAALTCTLSPVCATVLGWMFAGEAMGAADLAGIALILVALVLPGLFDLTGRSHGEGELTRSRARGGFRLSANASRR